MRLRILCLLGGALGTLSVPKKAQFQEHVDHENQMALTFTETDGSATKMEFELLEPVGAENIFKMEAEKSGGNLVGKLSLNKKPDREDIPEYTIMIRTFRAGNSLVNEKNAKITIIDANDHKPRIDQSSTTMYMKENEQPGEKIGTIIATDDDLDRFGELKFIKHSGPDTFHPRSGTTKEFALVFRLDADGTVYLDSRPSRPELDTEQFEKITFKFDVIDDPENEVHGTSTGEVTIVLGDVNDNAPKFAPVMDTSAEIDESAQPGDIVPLSLVATDADVEPTNKDVAFRVIGAGVPFAVNAQNELVVDGPLDFEQKNVYQVEIEAFNPKAAGDLTSKITVTINIVDNNEPPVCRFEQSEFPIENVDVQKVIGRLDCTDGDTGLQQLTYELVDPAGFFAVDGQTGDVSVISTPDREWMAKEQLARNTLTDYLNDGSHTVSIIVNDDGNPPMVLSTEINIKIEDAGTDDESPASFNNKDKLNICSEPRRLPETIFPVVHLDPGAQVDRVEVQDGPDFSGSDFQVTLQSGVMWSMTYTGDWSTFDQKMSEPLNLVATDSNGQSSTKLYTIYICNCGDEGAADDENTECSAYMMTAKKSAFPFWIIILIAALCLVILIAAVVAVKRRRPDQKPDHDEAMDDQTPFISNDCEGGEAKPGYNPGDMAIIKNVGVTHQGRPRPDGDLGDIINQCKDAADQEEIVPNALLSFEFEGRNSIISDLSSLHSEAPEEDLQLDFLPDQIQKSFR